MSMPLLSGGSTDSLGACLTYSGPWKHSTPSARVRFAVGIYRHEHACREDGIHSIGSRRRAGAFVDWRESPRGTAECESQGNPARPTAAQETHQDGDSDDEVGSPQQANPVCCACREVRHERLERLPSLQKCKVSFGGLSVLPLSAFFLDGNLFGDGNCYTRAFHRKGRSLW